MTEKLDPESPWPGGEYSHVLYVGDGSEGHDALPRSLGDGWSVLYARDGIHAMELLRHPERPGALVIVLDLSMPVLEGLGFEVARRADPDLSRHPLILVTPHAADPRVRKFGATHYEPRPLDPGSLAAAVRRLSAG